MWEAEGATALRNCLYVVVKISKLLLLYSSARKISLSLLSCFYWTDAKLFAAETELTTIILFDVNAKWTKIWKILVLQFLGTRNHIQVNCNFSWLFSNWLWGKIMQLIVQILFFALFRHFLPSVSYRL